MPLLPPVSDFVHNVRWSIQNFNNCPSWDDLVLTSPPFVLRLLDWVALKLSLQTQVPGKSMSFALHCVGNTDIFLTQRPFMAIGLSVPVAQKQLTRISNPTTPLKPSPIPSLLVGRFLLDGVYPGMPINGDTLVLQMTIKTRVDQDHFYTKMMDPHLVALSNDLVSMVTRPLHPDSAMVSQERVRLESHSCIIRARVPLLFQDGQPEVGNVDPDFMAFHTGIPTKALRALVFYLYGRLATSIPADQRRYLYDFALRYELRDLACMLCENPTVDTLGTSFVMEDSSFEVFVADLTETPTLPIALFPNSRNINATARWTLNHEKSLVFFVSVDSNPFQAPINMKFTVALQSESGEVMHKNTLWHTFADESVVWFSPGFAIGSASYVIKPFLFSCQIQMTKGQLDPSPPRREPTGYLLAFNNLLTLSEQLKSLYVNQVGCDFELHIGSKVFRVHKVVMVARSPMIRASVLKKEKAEGGEIDKIGLDEFFLECWPDVILYMYTGRLAPNTGDHMGRVATVADYLDMTFLVEHCTFLTVPESA